VGLLATVDLEVEVGGDMYNSTYHLATYELTSLLQIVAIVGGTHLRRGIKPMDELARKSSMRLVDDGDRYLPDHFVTVYPRIYQRIDQRRE
jgi:hypothetical protein